MRMSKRGRRRQIKKRLMLDMTDIIVIAILVLVVGAASFYIIREKKKGKRCIGCPYACNCSGADKNKCSKNK